MQFFLEPLSLPLFTLAVLQFLIFIPHFSQIKEQALQVQVDRKDKLDRLVQQVKQARQVRRAAPAPLGLQDPVGLQVQQDRLERLVQQGLWPQVKQVPQVTMDHKVIQDPQVPQESQVLQVLQVHQDLQV